MRDLRANNDYIFLNIPINKTAKVEKYFSGKLLDLQKEVDGTLKMVAEEFSLQSAEIIEKYKDSSIKWFLPFVDKLGSPPQWIVEKAFANAIINHAHGLGSDLAIITCSERFVRYIGANALVEVHGTIRFFLDKIGKWIMEMMQFVYTMAQILYVIMLSKIYLGRIVESRNYNKVALIRSYADLKYFSSDGTRYEDEKYKGFESFLTNNGYEVITEFNVSGITNMLNFFSKAANLKKNNYVIGYQEFGIKDLFDILMFGVEYFKVSIKEGLHRHQDGIGLSYGVQNYAKYIACLKLIKAYDGLNLIIFNWENKGYEKAIMESSRIKLPSLRFVGVQNGIESIFSPTFICGKKEHMLTPYPDKILFCGAHMHSLFNKINYKNIRTKIFPAPRHQADISDFNNDHVQSNTILVLFNINKRLSDALLDVVIKAAENSDRYKFILKAHPFMPLRKFAFGSLGNVEINERPVIDLLCGISGVIYAGETSVVCEAMGLRKAIAQFRPVNIYSIDSINFGNNLFPVFRNSSELMDIMCDLLSGDNNTSRESPFSYEHFYAQGKDYSELIN